MNLRARNEQGVIKIGVIDLYGNGREDAIIPFEMQPHAIYQQWTDHAYNIIRVIRSFVPNAEIHLVKKDKRGIEYLIDQGITIVSMSLAGRGEQPLEYLLKGKAFLVCGVGNSGDAGESWSAQQEFWCGVGAVGLTNIPKPYSSFGEGAVMTVAQLPELDGKTMQGTSFTCPVVVGLLAQWYIWYKNEIGCYPSIGETNDFIKLNSHDIFEDGKDLKTGWGLLRLPKKFEATEIIVTEGYRMARKIKHVEGEEDVISDVDLLISPRIIEGRTMVGSRGLTESLGITVYWNDVNHTSSYIKG